MFEVGEREGDIDTTGTVSKDRPKKIIACLHFCEYRFEYLVIYLS